MARSATRGGAPGASLPVRAPFFYGWIVLAVATVGMFASAPGQASILTVFIEPIGRETGWSRSVVSGALSAATLITALAMPATGYLFDRLGARLTLTGAGLLLGIGCLAMSRVANEVTLYLGVTSVRLLGMGVLYLTSTTLVARWFVRRRGRAMAAAVIGMAIGLATFPPILQRISEAAGWRSAWVFLAVVVWVLVILPSLLLVRSRPEDVGLLPDGSRAALPAQDPAAPIGPPIAEVGWQLSEVVRQRTFWLLVLATTVPFIVNVAVAFNQMPVLTANGLGAGEAAFTVSVYALSFAAGSLVAGWLADRLSVRLALIGTLFVLSLAVVILINARTLPIAVCFGVAFGLGAGANSTIERLIWPTYYGRQHLGRINGVVMFLQIGAASAGPLLAGLTYDLLGGYAPFFGVVAVLPVFCALATWLVGPPVERRPAAAGGA